MGGWSPLSIRNGGDAIQVRNPDGSYYHGVSYGGSEISGGPNNLKLFTGSGSGMMGFFNTGDFFDVSNWSSATVASGAETPGQPNNAANLAWLQVIRDPSAATCPISPLPVELHQFDGKKIKEGNLLYWQTQTESNSSYFTLERSLDLQKWELVSIKSTGENSQSTLNYSTVDQAFTQGRMNYYRLSQTDLDGSTEVFGKIVALDNSKVKAELVTIVNLLGQEIDEDTPGVQIHVYSDGTTVKVFKQ